MVIREDYSSRGGEGVSLWLYFEGKFVKIVDEGEVWYEEREE